MSAWPKWYGGASSSPEGSGGRAAPASRRAFLGGAAAVVTLPLLASLWPKASAAPPAPPVRLVFWFLPNGIIESDYRIEAAGPLPEALPPTLRPLEGFRSELLVLSGLSNKGPQLLGGGGQHPGGTGSFLTAAVIGEPTAEPSNGTSVDQVAAEALLGATPLRSLELGVTESISLGECFGGQSCAYIQNISWRDGVPNPKLTDPSLVFERLFAGFDPALTEAENLRRRRWRTSVLDAVLEDANRLHGVLSTDDRAKLDEYLTGIRELEQRLTADPGTCSPGAPPQAELDYPDLCRAMSDLTVAALQCDLTRVVTFMMEDGGSFRSFPFLGIPDAHHELSHHGGDLERIEKLVRIETWEMEQFAYLLEGMRSAVEADGTTLLDNSLCFLSSELSDGDTHDHTDLPVVLAGRAGGALEPGRHEIHDDAPPIADLFLAILETVGVEQDTFGHDGTQPLDLS